MSVAANVNPLTPRRKIKGRIEDSPLAIARAYEMSLRADDHAPQELWFWRGEYYRWIDGVYSAFACEDVRESLYEAMDGVKLLSKNDGNRTCKPNRTFVRDVEEALHSVCKLHAKNVPCWVAGAGPIPPEDVLAFRNGLLNLGAYLNEGDTRLIPPTATWFSTQVFPYDFILGAKCTRWLAFLHETFVGDQQRIDLLQEWFGYNLSRDLSRQKIMVMIGLGGAGKGTILQVLKAIVNEANVAAPSLDDLGDNFGLEPLIGKTVALIGETHVSRHTDAKRVLDRLKRISGGDPVDVNRKNLKRLNGVQLGVRFTIAGNEPFPMPDVSNGITRRLLGLRFTESKEGMEDIELLSKLLTEVPGIMLWAIEGLARLQEQRGFTRPADSIELVQEISRLTSPVRTFLDEQCIQIGTADAKGLSEEELSTPVEQVWDRWKWYAKKYGFREGTVTGLGMKLNAMLPFLQKSRNGGRNDRFNAYQGIKLRQNPAADYYVSSNGNGHGANGNGHAMHERDPPEEDPSLYGV